MIPPSHSPDNDPRPPPPWFYATVQKVEAPIAGLVGLNCREFAKLTVARIDRPLSRTEEIRFRIHGAMCSLCTKFAAQFSALNDLTKEIEAETAASHQVNAAAITRIADAVRAATKNERGSSGEDRSPKTSE